MRLNRESHPAPVTAAPRSAWAGRQRALVVGLASLLGCGTSGGPMDMKPVTTHGFTEIGLGGSNTWKFMPVHEQLGDVYDHGAGAAVGDIDGDGHEDIVLLGQCGKPGYFLGHGDGTFTDASARLASLADGVRVGIAYGDYDNDGRTDLYVSFVRRPNALLHQNADGSFTDVGISLGVGAVGHYSGVVFVDVNGDGYLDILVAGNQHHTTTSVMAADPARQCPATYDSLIFSDAYEAASDPSSLFINGGPGKGFAFTDEAAVRGIPMGGGTNGKVGPTTRGFSDATTVDFDRDGHPDLVMSDMFFGRTAILHNDGTGHFTEVTDAIGVRPSNGPATITAADYDNDGWPDFYMTDMHSDMWSAPEATADSVAPNLRYKGATGPAAGAGDNPTGPLFGNSLWLGATGGKSFREVDAQWQAETYQPWGNNPVDFDNDGDMDVFIASGMSNPYAFWPNILLVNTGSQFEQKQGEVGLDPPPDGRVDPGVRVFGQPYVSSSRCAAVGDFDENGTMDMVVVNWNHRAHVLRNDVPAGSHWLEVNLVGKAPRDPYGAFVEVSAGGRTLTRWMQGAGGYLSQSTRWVHFGLGSTSTIDSVTVRWPDGTSSSAPGVAVDTRVTITQK